MTYDELLSIADEMGLIVKEKSLLGCKGRIKGNRIAIRKDIPTLKEKSCILAEEIAHHLINVGDILNQNITENCKQEFKAMAVAYDMQVGLGGIIEAYEAGCVSSYMAAEYLEVTEAFFCEAIKYYEEKYGVYAVQDKYIIYFKPSLCIMKMIG